MDEHDAGQCDDCVIQTFEANGHSMRMIVPCNERIAYWACITCDQIEKWPVVEDIRAANEILNAMLYIHCLDKLVLA